jgi:uncharacterized protein (DUF4415 family)
MSDWQKIDAMRDTDAECNAQDDPDNPPTDETFWADAELYVPDPRKVPIHIRVTPEILAFFKKDGPGYQTRINRVLEQYVQWQQQRT